MIRLTGSQNPLIKEVRSLKNKSSREEKELYFIEGTRFVSEALKERIDIRYAVFSESFLASGAQSTLADELESSKISCYEVPDKLFGTLSDTQNPQGILAVLQLERLQLEALKQEGGLLVLLDQIKDPGNMGTIIRTADAAGCTGVILPDGCVDVFNPKVLRATMGSVFHIPIYHCGNILNAMNYAKKLGYKLCASHLEGSVNIYETDLSGAVALVIGSEATGIGEETVKAAEQLIRIPMDGKAESLNASVAAGIMIFEVMRQKKHGRIMVTSC